MPVKENKVVYGLKNVHYSKMTIDQTGKVVYAKPTAIKGAVEISLESKADLVSFEADNEVYYSAPGTSSYDGTLTIAKVPDLFLVDILGEVLDETDGIQTEIDGAKTSNFALLFQFEGDNSGVRHLFYNCSASRPSVASKTGKEIGTTELGFTASAKPSESVNDKAIVKAKTTGSTTEAVYNAWFDAVYVKAPAAG
ncbi:MAG: phage tail protein [Lactococcus sp.]|nr:major tail protein [Lactococcus sp.]MDN6491085.1 phage tail protein [Leuconostoc sp.]MDN6778953.1 phage tail protein [Lactobacillus sp.]MDN5402867.1 phage tail protein [Lactococcus sp.]MDN5410072.1 phage tail protein [Lactococcus sp.]MDN5411185.1 phage tail protein [Lactococcus sp.]